MTFHMYILKWSCLPDPFLWGGIYRLEIIGCHPHRRFGGKDKYIYVSGIVSLSRKALNGRSKSYVISHATNFSTAKSEPANFI